MGTDHGDLAVYPHFVRYSTKLTPSFFIMEIPTSYPCLKLSCGRWFTKTSHRLLHMEAKHPELSTDVAPSSPAVTDADYYCSTPPSSDSGPGGDFGSSVERNAEAPVPGTFLEVAIEGPATLPIPAPMGSDVQEDPVTETPIVEEQRINHGSSNEEEGPTLRHDEGNESRFFGTDDRPFYRRHHRVLSGKFFSTFCSVISRCMKANPAMHKEIIYLPVHLHLRIVRKRMIGRRSIAKFSLSWLIFCSAETRCLEQTLKFSSS